ncbi:hypothetical protein [Streptomyces sp. NPDC047097]|uniref:hypothetical protein n=1 Tax=Streptomyces sp. NPDC047097 TaxID=3155260 RepID=UPI0034012A28
MTDSFDRASLPAAAQVVSLETEVRRLNDSLELATADLGAARKRLHASGDLISELRSLIEHEKAEAHRARERHAELRKDAHGLLRSVVDDYRLDGDLDEISDKAESIGLDPLIYTHTANITVRFSISGLRRNDGAEVTEDEVREWVVAELRATGELRFEDYETEPGEIEIEEE